MSTLRSRAIIHGTAAAPISVSSQDSQSTQESSTTESTTTSSHLKDSQDQDEDYGEYEPDTQTVGPEGPQINEFGKEVQSLLEDRHTVNMDMVIAEREHGGKATTSTATHGHNAPEPKTAHKVNHEPTLPPSTKPTDTYMDDGMDEDQAAEDNSFSSAGSITQSYRRVIVAESHPCDKEPTITYAEVAPLVNKGQASCGPCTASYTITARNFDPENPDHQCKLIADTEKHGRKKGFNRPIVIDISSSGNRNKTVKVCWADMEDFKTAKRIGFRIYWKGIPYSATTWGPALPLRSRVIKVHLSATESGTALADAFRGSTHKWLSITHLWTITTRPSDDSQPPRQTGIVVAIVEFKNDNKELPLDWFELALLVLWVWCGNTYFETSFDGRMPACRSCRGNYGDPHIQDHCPTPYCKKCRKNHPVDECTRRKGPEQDAQHPHPPPRTLTRCPSGRKPLGPHGRQHDGTRNQPRCATPGRRKNPTTPHATDSRPQPSCFQQYLQQWTQEDEGPF
ncbi:hypothetical protein A4X03_0g6178 [Tilletia caries]|uniref:Uncharacterized protein n=1 Tax=Tilletia caries TaxID=13290 RepID=A0A8T8SZW6_9BASI|nr:hypothetical protein A4X03_0g6178 [Tilletia caries]